VGFIQFIALILTVYVLRLTARRQLRAYISVETSAINPYGNSGDRFLAHVGIRNNGETPAQNLNYGIKMVWKKEGDWQPPQLRTLTETDTTIQPRTETRLGSQPESTTIIETAKGETSYLYVYGRVRYRHEFSRRARFTEFYHRYNCSVFDWESKTLPPDNGRYHEKGNKAD
jgi:hypothetical protein